MSAVLGFLALKSHDKPVSIAKDAVVCRLGDMCEGFVVLTQGRVKVLRIAEDGRHITLYYIQPGEGCVLTAACLLNQKSFPAIAVTQEASTGYMISKSQFKNWLDNESVWRSFVFALLALRMGDLILKVDQLAFDSLETRLMHWLTVQPQAPNVTVTHQQVAQELASSREVISRSLKKLESKGLVTLKRGEIILNKLRSIR